LKKSNEIKDCTFPRVDTKVTIVIQIIIGILDIQLNIQNSGKKNVT